MGRDCGPAKLRGKLALHPDQPQINVAVARFGSAQALRRLSNVGYVG